MIYKDLARLVDYNIPIIEIYNAAGDLEYVLDLEEMYMDDIDIVWENEDKCYGIIKLQRDEQEYTQLNGKKL